MFRFTDYRLVRWLFPRLLGVVYLLAFASWATQYHGLVGAGGIMPVEQLIEQVREHEARQGDALWLKFPAIQYFNGSDAFAFGLLWACGIGAVLVTAGVAQRWLLMLLWVGYLSFVTTGSVFMSFQWDALLLEAGLLGVWLAPGAWLAGRAPRAPPRGSIFLVHWLLFRLMLQSGLVKVGGGDRVWLDMTALLYHYETQPLPHELAWWMHQLPPWVHVGCCWAMHFIELLLPFAIFLGRWGRLAACVGFLGFMGAIFATGNYTYFNILTAVLALTLLDDSWWPRGLKQFLGITESATEPRAPTSRSRYERWVGGAKSALGIVMVTAVVVLTLLAADAALAARLSRYRQLLPDWAHERLYQPLAPLHAFNAYGLFQDMTEERLEVVLEVSDDGLLWLPLEFKWKPGDVMRKPAWVAPHQPRLDWQMWFVALTPGFDPRRDMRPGSPTAWFGQFLSALLQHQAAVWDLLEPPPFPREQIRHVRARLYRYHFTTIAERRDTRAWWRREYLGAFSPTFSAQQPEP